MIFPAGTSRSILVLRDRGVGDTLVFVENGVGQGDALPTDLEPTIRERKGVHVLADEIAGYVVDFEHVLFAFIHQRELLAEIARVAPAQHICQAIRFDIHSTVQVVGAGRGLGKLRVVFLYKAGKEGVAVFDASDPGKPQFFHEPILQRPVRAFHASLCLAGVGAQNLNVQL